MGVRPAGFSAPGFEHVHDAFADILNQPGEVGGAFAATIGDRAVVDLWGGWTEEGSETPWRRDTILMIFSGSKGICAILFLALADRGIVDIDEPVSGFWPEFAAKGKGDFTIRDVLNHRVGLPSFEDDVLVAQLADQRGLAARLARQAPHWPRASGRMTYHPLTHGVLAAEIAYLLLGRSIGEAVEIELAKPLGLDLHIGTREDVLARCAKVHPTQAFADEFDQLLATSGHLARAYRNPALFRAPLIWNRADILGIEVPAINACGSARSIAALYGDICLSLSGTSKLLTTSRGVKELSQHSVAGLDPHAAALEDLVGVGASELRFSQGFEMQTSGLPLGPPADAFGHTGAGGSVHGAWPSLGVGFSYCTNTMRAQRTDDRGTRLLTALHEAVVGR